MRMDKLSWIQPKHLDISQVLENLYIIIEQEFCDSELWETAGAELNNINNFVTPKFDTPMILFNA